MSDELQIFIDAETEGSEGEELIGGDAFLDELWHATRRAPRAYPGSYMFGLDVLGAAPMLTAEAKAPGSTNANPVAVANRLKSKGQLAVEAGQRAIASSRRYRAGRKLGQQAVAAGQKALGAGKKAMEVAATAAKAAAKVVAASPKASAKAFAREGAAARVAQIAAVRAPVVAPRTIPVAARAPMTMAPRTVATAATPTVQRTATRLRGEAIGADSATPEALEAAAAAWADMASTVEKLNTTGEAAAQVADQAEKRGVDATSVWNALAEAFSEEPYKQGFVVQWSNYAYGPEIADGAAEARTTAAQWTAKLNPLVEQLKQQLAQGAAGAAGGATGSADGGGGSGGGKAPGGFDPGTPGAFPLDESDGGRTSSETLQRFRESGGAWDPFEDDGEVYAEEEYDPEAAFADDEQEYDPEAAEALLDEEDAFSAGAGMDTGHPVFSDRRRAVAAAIAGSFDADEDAQAFVARRELLEDGVLDVEDSIAGLDFQTQYIFMPHTAIVDWQKEKDAQLAAGNEAAQQAQVDVAQQAAAAARAKQPGAKLSPAVAMRLAAARQHLAQARARMAQANAASADPGLITPREDE